MPPVHVSFSTLTNLAKRFDMILLIRVILHCRMEEAKFIHWTLNKLSIQFNQKLMQCSVNELQALLRACSHGPRTVNYPVASVTSRSHDDLLSRGNVASSSLSDHYEFI